MGHCSQIVSQRKRKNSVMVQLNKKVSVAISNIIDINDKIRESLFNEPNIDTVTDATASYKRHQALYVPLMRVFDELTFKDIISIEAVMIVGKNGLEYLSLNRHCRNLIFLN